MQVWPAYRHVRHDDPLPGGARNGSPLPDREWFGQALTISDFSAIASSAAGDCTPRSASRSACGL